MQFERQKLPSTNAVRKTGLAGLSDWLNVRLEECLVAGPPVQSFRKTVIQYIIVRKKSKSLKISKFKI